MHDIGFSYPVDESFFVAEIEALRTEATKLGARLHVHTAKENRDNQSRQILEFVDAGLDLILIEPVATEGLEDACARAHAARIPVVAIGSAVSGADAVVATDNTKAGSLAGTALAKALDGQGRLAVVGGIPITANSDRIAGFLAAIAPHPHLTVIATSYGELDAPSGERAADEILAAAENFRHYGSDVVEIPLAEENDFEAIMAMNRKIRQLCGLAPTEHLKEELTNG